MGNQNQRRVCGPVCLIYVGVVSPDLQKEVHNYSHNPLVIALRDFKTTEFGFIGLDVQGLHVEFNENNNVSIIKLFKDYHENKLDLSFEDMQFYLQEM